LIANEIRKKEPEAPIYFVWVGGAAKGDFRFFELEFDLRQLGLQDRCDFSNINQIRKNIRGL